MHYEAPRTLKEAVALLSAGNGRCSVLAGGTDLVVGMRGGKPEPDLLVDVKHIPEMTTIVSGRGGIRFGAAVPCMALLGHEALARAWPGVIDGIRLIGSVQVKGRATVGGNLCNASPAADSVPALIAAGARVRITGPGGNREALVEQVVTGPGTTSLGRGEIVTSILLPRRLPRSGDAYLRFTPRTEMDIAVVGAAVNLTLSGKGLCTDARVCLGAVGARQLLVPAASAALVGTFVDSPALEALAAAARAACQPIDDKRGTKAFRIQVAGVIARRAAERALARAKEKK